MYSSTTLNDLSNDAKQGDISNFMTPDALLTLKF
jgi:hypothetical protein